MKKQKTKVKSPLVFKHIFIPHQKNGYRPHAFRHRMLTLYSFVLLSSQVLFGLTYYSGTSLAAETPAVIKLNVLTLTNEERTNQNQPALKENPVLDRAAEAKLEDMFQNNYWDHVSPQGKEPWDFIKKFSYQYQFAGENLAKGFIDGKSAVKAWMASDSHKDNILNPNYQEIGVAVGEGKLDNKPTLLIVQMFGSQKGSFVASAQSEKATSELNISPANITIKERLPYFVMWLVLFALLVFDGIMLRRAGLHRSKKQLFQFRAALLVNALILILLALNYVAIA